MCVCMHVHVSTPQSFGVRGIIGLTRTTFCLGSTFLFNRKWQEANEKIQELQASQEAREDQEQKIKVSGCMSPRSVCGRHHRGGPDLPSPRGVPSGLWGHLLPAPAVPFALVMPSRACASCLDATVGREHVLLGSWHFWWAKAGSAYTEECDRATVPLL